MVNVYVYFFAFRNDIALMKLDSPVYDNGYVAIAQLPYSEQILPDGFTCYITGWGLLASKYEVLRSFPLITFWSMFLLHITAL